MARSDRVVLRHAPGVVLVDDVDNADVPTVVRAALKTHALFPERAGIVFILMLDRDKPESPVMPTGRRRNLVHSRSRPRRGGCRHDASKNI